MNHSPASTAPLVGRSSSSSVPTNKASTEAGTSPTSISLTSNSFDNQMWIDRFSTTPTSPSNGLGLRTTGATKTNAFSNSSANSDVRHVSSPQQRTNRRASPTRISPTPNSTDRVTPPPLLAPPRISSPSVSKYKQPATEFIPMPIVQQQADPEAGLTPELIQALSALSFASVGEAGIEFLRQKVLELDQQKKRLAGGGDDDQGNSSSIPSSREGTPLAHQKSQSRHRKQDSRDSITVHIMSNSPSTFDSSWQQYDQQQQGSPAVGRLAPNVKMFDSSEVAAADPSIKPLSPKPPSPKLLSADVPKVMRIPPSQHLFVGSSSTDTTAPAPPVIVPDLTKSKNIGSRPNSAFRALKPLINSNTTMEV